MSGDAETMMIRSDEPEAKALLRLLSYAFDEASSMGLEDCADLISRAAEQVRQRIGDPGTLVPMVDHTRIH